MNYNAYKVDPGDIDNLLNEEDGLGNDKYPGLKIYPNTPDSEYYVTEAWGDEIKKDNPQKVTPFVMTSNQNDATAGGYPLSKKKKMYD